MTDSTFLDMTSCVTATLDAPIDVVWPCLLEQAAWMREFRIETVAGEHNQEGEIKSVMHLEPEPGWEDFFFKTLLLVPYRKFLYKAYTGSRTGRYGFTGIEVLTLGDHGRDTSITFEAYLELTSVTMKAADFAQFVKAATDDSVAMWGRNFARLRALVSSGKQRSC